jgi:hypothetical protein
VLEERQRIDLFLGSLADGRRFLRINSTPKCYFGSAQVASFNLTDTGHLKPFLL